MDYNVEKQMLHRDQYESAAMQDKMSLGQELQVLHKLVNDHDDLMDALTARLEPMLTSPQPNAIVDNPNAGALTGQSAMRDEIQNLCGRWSAQNSRLRGLLARLDV